MGWVGMGGGGGLLTLLKKKLLKNERDMEGDSHTHTHTLFTENAT